jgi:acyl-CoA synthetase (AMP-forming)/AMP-acid ligase II/acyl carrier protein
VVNTLVDFDAPDSAVAFIAAGFPSATFGQIKGRISKFKLELEKFPLPENARVITLLKDAPSTALIQICLCEHATAIPLNPSLTPAELGKLVRSSRAQAILTEVDNEFGKMLAEEFDMVHLVLTSGSDGFCGDFGISVSRPSTASTQPQSGERISVVLSTSGSTAAPKRVPISKTSLAISARNIAGSLNLKADDTALHMLPMFHVGSLVDLCLAPLSVGGSVHFAHPISTENFKRGVLDSQATWAQAVPTMLHDLANSTSKEEMIEFGKSLRFVRSVSSDLSTHMQSEMEQRLNGVPLIQMYGMTETAGQISSNPLPPAVRKARSVGTVQGVELSLRDTYGARVREGETGEICVKGPTVTDGYEGIDNASHFAGSWLRTGDTGWLDQDGYLFLSGRKKDIINRGGEKISPLEIDRALQSHPSIVSAAAFGVSHASLGEEVAAAVVLGPGFTCSDTELKSFLKQSIADYKCPRKIWFLDELPMLGSGKVDRNALREWGNRAGTRTLVKERSKTALGTTLAKIWQRTLNQQNPGLDDDFFDLGGDSLSATTFLLELEKQIGAEVPVDLLYEAPSLRRLETVLGSLKLAPHQGKLPSKIFNAVKSNMVSWKGHRPGAHSLLIGHNLAGAKAPFFWFCAGTSQFESLAAEMGSDRPIYVMRTLSGLSVKTDANVRALAEYYADEIDAIDTQGDIKLGGFCHGAALARQVSRCLKAKGRTVGLLVVIDRVFRDVVEEPSLYFWSMTSIYSAQSIYVDPERGLGLHHPAGAVGHKLSGAHTQVIEPAHMKEICKHLLPALDHGSRAGRTKSGLSGGQYQFERACSGIQRRHQGDRSALEQAG